MDSLSEQTKVMPTDKPTIECVTSQLAVRPLSDDVLSVLDLHTKEWASSLSATDLSFILQAVYRIPGVTYSLRSLVTGNDSTNVSAAEIGKRGEEAFEKICKSLPENYQIVNTAKQGKMGDFIIYYSDGRLKKSCLVDIKKYSTTVPRKELNKFYEDLTFGNYDAGLIISYHTKFAGIHDNIFIEQKDLSYGKIPIMYLADVPSEFIVHAVKIIMQKAAMQADRDISSTKLESMLSYVNSALGQSSATRRVLSELNSSVSHSIQKCQEQLVTLEIQIKRTIKEISGMIDLAVVVNLPKVPAVSIPARDDNLDSKNLDVSNLPEIPPYVPVAIPIASRKPISKLPPLKKNALNFSEIPQKDLGMVRQLSNFEWTKISDLTLENDAITIRLEPLKTKTRVILEQSIDDLDTLDEFFKMRKGELCADLSPKLIDAIEKTFDIEIESELEPDVVVEEVDIAKPESGGNLVDTSNSSVVQSS
jgi:hypothetical protein